VVVGFNRDIYAKELDCINISYELIDVGNGNQVAFGKTDLSKNFSTIFNL
jgi:hypothetical protein